jgi:hypothetical protein
MRRAWILYNRWRAAVKSPSIPLSLILLGAVFLVLVGLRPQSLPFIPDAPFSDAAISHWPAALHLRQAVLERGEWPVWQDTILGSGPFAANPLNKTAYPLQWLALILPPALHINMLIVLHLFVAGWGMWRWARALDLPGAAAALSALAFAFAPKVLAHVGAGHVDLLYALAWWPWLMYAVRLWFAGNSRAGSTIIRAGLFASLMILADVRLSLFGLTLAAAYALWQAGQQKRWRGLAWGVPALIVVALLTLSVIVPLLIWQPYLSRSAMSASDAGVFSLESGHLVGLLLPPHGGNQETITYLGLPVLLLAGIAICSAPRKHAFWLIAILLAALYALGINTPLWRLLVDALPFLHWFRVPARAWFVVVLAASVLAGYGLQVVMQSVERMRHGEEIRRLAIKRLATAGALAGSLFCGGFTLTVLADLPGTIGVGVMLVGTLVGVILLLGLYRRLTAHRLALLLIAVLFIDLTWTGRNWVEWRGPERWLTHQQALVDALEADNVGRIYSPNFALQQQVAAANSLHLFYGIDPFQLSGIVDAVERASGVPVTKYTVVLPPLELEPAGEDDERTPQELLRAANQIAVPDTSVLAEWGVSHVVATYSIEHDRLSLAAELDGTFIYRNLDYDPQTELNAFGWPQSGWPGLPDTDTVMRLNQMTSAAALVAGLAFIGCAVWFIWKLVRR